MGLFGKKRSVEVDKGASTSYAEWSQMLDILAKKEKDSETLSAMKAAKIAWQSVVAERFSEKLASTINDRLRQANDRFQREMNHSKGEERIMVQAMLALRKEYSFLRQVADLPALPDEIRRQFIDLVQSSADSSQKSLESSAQSERSGRLTSLVRNQAVNKL